MENGDAIDAFDRELLWSGTSIDKDQWRGDRSRLAVRERYLKRLGSDKTRLAPKQIQACHWFDKALEIGASTLDHGLFAFAYSRQIDRNGTSADAVLTTTLCQIGDACAGDHRFSGSATGVNTNTAQVAALDHRYLAACLRERNWEKSATLTGTDDDHIIIRGLWHAEVLLPPLHTSIIALHLQAIIRAARCV